MPTKIKVGGCQLCRVRKQIALPGRLQNDPKLCGCYIQYSKGDK